jgi:hypothetical protein
LPEQHAPLPARDEWQLDRSSVTDAATAEALATSASPSEFVGRLGTSLSAALTSHKARFGREQDFTAPQNARVVVQFPVSDQLFDWFANARTGYRAHFRASPQRGMAFNDEIIQALRLVLMAALPASVQGRLLRKGLIDLGPVWISSDFIMCSLVQEVFSKVWVATDLMGSNSSPTPTPLDVRFMGAEIKLPAGIAWKTITCSGNNAWLDVKGAFVDHLRSPPFYQPKDPWDRAAELHDRGHA